MNGSCNYYDCADITDFSLQVNLKLSGGADNAFRAEPATGLSIQWTIGKHQPNV